MAERSPEPEVRWNFRLPEPLWDEFTNRCKELGVSKAAVAKMLIGEWLAGMKNGAERAWIPAQRKV